MLCICVNRIEEIDIFSIQTFHSNDKILTDKYFKKYDIFYNFTNLGTNYTLDPNYIYITIPLYQDVTDNWFDNSSESGDTDIYPDNNYNNPFKVNPFPLVITCDVSEFQKQQSSYNFINQLTMTTFWDLRIYTNGPYVDKRYNENEMYNISYYKISDIIKIPDLNLNLIRLALRWSPISSKGMPFQNSFPKPDYSYYKPLNNKTNIISNNLNDYFKNKDLVNIIYDESIFNVKIGRSSIPCRLIYGKFNSKFQSYKTENINETKKVY